MFCGKCGTENPNENNFCMKCGHPLSPVEIGNSIKYSASANKAIGENKAPEVNIIKFANILKIIPKKFLFGALAAILLIVFSIVFIVKSSNTINLNKYLSIKVSGYDGYGKADYEIDWDAIKKKYGSKIALTSEGVARLDSVNSVYSLAQNSIVDKIKPIDILKDAVRVELNEKNNLSNGTEISYTWTVDEDLKRYLDFNLNYKDGTHKITELKELQTFDVFSDVDVEFSGIAPQGKATINYKGSALSSYDFDLDRSTGLNEGDEITVKFNAGSVETCAEKLGKVPEKLEKTYTVTGLDSYLTNVNKLDKDTLQAMKNQAVTKYNAEVAQTWGKGEDLLSLTYIGNYLLTSKSSDQWGPYNSLYLVYKAHIHNYYSDTTQVFDQITDNYWYIKYDDLILNSDGTLNYDPINFRTPNYTMYVDTGISSGFFSTIKWSYSGYDSLNKLYEKEIVKQSSYNHIDSIDESSVPTDTIPETTASTEIISTDYVLPNSASELISESDLTGFDAAKCKLARNEIYARHGRKFDDDSLQAYFNSKAWYNGSIEPGAFQESVLSDIEINNRNIILNYEKAMGFT